MSSVGDQGSVIGRRGRPEHLKTWLDYESKWIVRGADPSLLRPATNAIPHRFLPERQWVADLPAWSIRYEHSHLTRSDTPADLGVAERFWSSKRTLFPVHPAARSAYDDLIDRVPTAKRAQKLGLLATPTSSARTLLIWSAAEEEFEPFFAKLSIPYRLGDSTRKIGPEVVARSVAITSMLEHDGDSLPDSFAYLPEPVGVNLLGAEGIGVIFRTIPGSILSGEQALIPLYALANPRISPQPILLNWFEAGDFSSVSEMFERTLLRPFSRQWLRLVMRHGLLPEPHAQNQLVEVDARTGTPTGRLYHRDFEAFKVDVEFRRRRGLFVPDQLIGEGAQDPPTRDRLRSLIVRSLHIYYCGSVMYLLDMALRHAAFSALRAGLERSHSSIRELFAAVFADECHRELGTACPTDTADQRLLMAEALIASRDEAPTTLLYIR